MTRFHYTALIMGGLSILLPQHAFAEETVREREVVRVRITPESSETMEEEEEEAKALEDRGREPIIEGALFTPLGAGMLVTGGYKNFVEPGVTDTLTPGGYWDIRGILGTRSFVGLEAAYHGSAQDVEAIGLQSQSYVVSNGVEGALRLNAPITQAMFPQANLQAPVLFEPFAFGGVGWQRYTLVNEGENTSAVASDDDILTVPFGAGLAVSIAGLHLDGRITYRHALYSGLLGTATSSFADTSLNSWSVGGGLGFEF